MTLHGTERTLAMTSPMEIAHNPLFTTKEKIDFLNELKAEVTGEDFNPDDLSFEPEEIDEAIQQIKLEVQDGDRPQPSVLGGGYERHDH
jgi:hypothetical protein